jgi:hypothetical protein
MKNPLLRSRLLNEAAVIGSLRIRAEAAYATLDAQASQVNAQRQANAQQQAQVTAQFQAAMKQLGVKADTIKRVESRVASDMKRATTVSLGNTASVRAIATSAVLFGTYYDFPLEREKRQLLDSFKNP